MDTPVSERDEYLEEELAQFPYVNGGLFADETIEIPPFTEEIKELLLTKASEDFDWSDISPTIFGAVFESTLNPETRRSGGMHYTSIENIHKVISPLFLEDVVLNESGDGEETAIERKLSFEEFNHRLEIAKQKLTPRQRELFELNKEQGITITEIAAKALISEQSVVLSFLYRINKIEK